MKLACNASKELFKLIVGEKVHVDYVKCQLEALSDPLPMHYIVYGDLLLSSLGKPIPRSVTANYSKIQWGKVKKQLKASRSPHYGIPLQAELADFTTKHPRNRWMDRAVENIQSWKDQTGCEILVENTYMNEHLSESILSETVYPEMIRKICEKAQVGLLLDIAHAHIASDYLKMDRYDYLEKLPLELVKEVHVSGTVKVNHQRRDVHEVLDQDDYDLIKWLLKRVPNAEFITLTYGTLNKDQMASSDQDKLLEQLERLERLIEEMNDEVKQISKR